MLRGREYNKGRPTADLRGFQDCRVGRYFDQQSNTNTKPSSKTPESPPLDFTTSRDRRVQYQHPEMP